MLAATRPGADLRRCPDRLRRRVRRGRTAGRLARALPGRPDRLPPARVRDRARASARAAGTGSRSRAGHAVAWNPSIAGGGKSEDTFLIEADGSRCMTDTGAGRRSPSATGVRAPRSSTSSPGRPRESRRSARAPRAARHCSPSPVERRRASPTAPPSASRSRASRAPRVLAEVVRSAEQQGIVVNRVSQGSGAMLLRESRAARDGGDRRRGRHRGLALHRARARASTSARTRARPTAPRTSGRCAACAASPTPSRTSHAPARRASAAS